MKLSKFNNIITYQDVDYLYNAFSDKFVAVDPDLLLIYKAIPSEKGIKDLAEIHPTFYQSMIRNGFILDDEIDEVESVKQLSREVDSDETHFTLIVNPTMNCNFKCWYCYETHEKGSKMSEEMVTKVCAFISNVLADNKKLETFQLSWFGGEPLMYYKDVIVPIMTYAQEACRKRGVFLDFQFTTNGFLFTDEIIQELKKYHISGIQITLDGNKDHHDAVRFVNSSRGSFDAITQNIRKLCENDLHVGVRVNYTNNNLTNFEETFDTLCLIPEEKRIHATIAFHKVWQERESPSTTLRVTELLNKVKKLGFVADIGAVPDNVRHSCYADKVNSATINYNGNIFKCTARDFSTHSREGVLNDDGYIAWNAALNERMNIKFKNKPCLECSILPLCNGGCSQHALENQDKDYCVYGFDEGQKKEILKKKLMRILN